MTEWFPAGSPTLKQQMEEGRRSMNRIDEIKGRIENYKSEYLPLFENNGEVHEWNAMFGDVQYLLSKLEKVDTWLSDIVHIGKSDPEYALKIAEANLNKLRE